MAPEREPPERSADDIEAFSQKIEKARESERSRRVWGRDLKEPPKSALGLAFRVAVELVSAVAVGGLIGWGLDYLFGTRPWLMVVFLILGGAAGVLNVYRMAVGFGGGMGYQAKDEAPGAGSADGTPEEGKDRGG